MGDFGQSRGSAHSTLRRGASVLGAACGAGSGSPILATRPSRRGQPDTDTGQLTHPPRPIARRVLSPAHPRTPTRDPPAPPAPSSDPVALRVEDDRLAVAYVEAEHRQDAARVHRILALLGDRPPGPGPWWPPARTAPPAARAGPRAPAPSPCAGPCLLRGVSELAWSDRGGSAPSEQGLTRADGAVATAPMASGAASRAITGQTGERPEASTVAGSQATTGAPASTRSPSAASRVNP